jgi:hypothetical protein
MVTGYGNRGYFISIDNKSFIIKLFRYVVSRKNVALFGVLFEFSFLFYTQGRDKRANHLLRISAIELLMPLGNLMVLMR